MRPLLFQLFGIPFPSYGVFMAVGFAASFVWAYIEAKRVGLDVDKVLDVSFWILISAVLGARILFIIVETDYLKTDPWEMFRVWNGGFVLYGGVFGVLIGATIAIRYHKLPWGEMADIIAQASVLGLVFGRMGCLLNGCCHGRPTDVPWAIVFTNHTCQASQFIGIPLHPTQIYESLALFAIFLILALIARHKRFSGQVFWAMYILYPIARFTIEIFRGDPRGWVHESILSRLLVPIIGEQTFSDPSINGFFKQPYLSTSQFISIFIFIVAVFGYVVSSRHARRKPAVGTGDNLQSLKENGKD